MRLSYHLQKKKRQYANESHLSEGIPQLKKRHLKNAPDQAAKRKCERAAPVHKTEEAPRKTWATLIRPATLSLTASVTHATYIAGLTSSSTISSRQLNSDSIPSVRGLPNIGNTCFLNATVQLLRVICRRLRISSFTKSTCPLFQLLFANTTPKYNRVVDQHPLWQTLAKNHQHDPQELILLLLNDDCESDTCIHKSCNKFKCLATKLKNVFTVHFKTTLQCTESQCSWQSSPPPIPQVDISLNVRQTTLRQVLSMFQAPEFFTEPDSYSCQKCKRGLVQHTCQVQPRGQILLLHLKRFEYVQEIGSKLDTHVAFSKHLEIDNVHYDFVGMIEHQNNQDKCIHKGHYIAYVQDSLLMCCNDNAISTIEWKDLKKKTSIYTSIYAPDFVICNKITLKLIVTEHTSMSHLFTFVKTHDSNNASPHSEPKCNISFQSETGLSLLGDSSFKKEKT